MAGKPGVRLNPKNAESVRQKIQITQLVNRVQGHGLGNIEMTSSQLDAAKFLINKRMPNPPEQTDVNVAGQITVIVKKFGNRTPE